MQASSSRCWRRSFWFLLKRMSLGCEIARVTEPARRAHRRERPTDYYRDDADHMAPSLAWQGCTDVWSYL